MVIALLPSCCPLNSYHSKAFSDILAQMTNGLHQASHLVRGCERNTAVTLTSRSFVYTTANVASALRTTAFRRPPSPGTENGTAFAEKGDSNQNGNVSKIVKEGFG